MIRQVLTENVHVVPEGCKPNKMLSLIDILANAFNSILMITSTIAIKCKFTDHRATNSKNHIMQSVSFSRRNQIHLAGIILHGCFNLVIFNRGIVSPYHILLLASAFVAIHVNLVLFGLLVSNNMALNYISTHFKRWMENSCLFQDQIFPKIRRRRNEVAPQIQLEEI